MKEFVKELINELEEYAERYDDIAFAEMNENGQTLDFEYARGKTEATKEIAFTIKRLAEKYSDAAAVPITPEMKADLLDCIKETKVPGGESKDCNNCSLNKTNYHGKAFCEVDQIKEKILQGAEQVKKENMMVMVESMGLWMPKEMCSIDRTGEVDDCDGCRDMCEEFEGQGCEECPVQKCFTRLAEYESLGVTPEQIREMDRLYAEKCKEVAELEKRLQVLKGE